jgi:hypothetical protein
MRRISSKQHSASAVGVNKPRVVRPSAAVFERLHTDVRAADTAQHGFDLLTCDQSLPIFRRSTEAFRQSRDTEKAKAAFLATVDQGTIGLKAAMAETPYA